MPYSEKYMHAAGVMEVSGRFMKRYDISAMGTCIPDGIQRAAASFLPQLIPEVDEETSPAGWVILHKGAAAPAYLVAYSWAWGNVVECHAAVAGIPELGCDDENPENFKILDRPWMGCVWELAPFGHERSAWVRHILQPSVPDLEGYLTDVLADGSTEGRS